MMDQLIKEIIRMIKEMKKENLNISILEKLIKKNGRMVKKMEKKYNAIQDKLIRVIGIKITNMGKED